MSFELEKLLDEIILKLRKEYSGSDKEFNQKLERKFPGIFQVLEEIFKTGLIGYYESKILEDIRLKEKKYRDNLFEDYKKGFDYLQIFIDVNKYCGKRVLEEYEKKSDKESHSKYSLLFRIQSRACQVATEIQTLLRYGYPDGAHARWRTIHELSVVFSVIFENSDEITQMFMDYEIIEKLKRAKDFEEQRHKINWPPLDDREIEEMQKKKHKLIDKYGKDFCSSYGWTLSLLPKGKRNFRELEHMVGLDYMRPFYAWSSDNVHPGISGLVSRLGQIEKGRTSYLQFAGPSFYGLADPAQFTTTSLKIITQRLLGIHDDLESNILHSLLNDLDSEVKDSFFKSQSELKRQYFEE